MSKLRFTLACICWIALLSLRAFVVADNIPAATEPTTRSAGAPDAALQQLKEKLATTLPSLKQKSLSLGDIVTWLQDVSGADIVVDWTSLNASGVTPQTTIAFSAPNQTLRAALDDLVQQSPHGALNYATLDDAIVLSTPDQLRFDAQQITRDGRMLRSLNDSESMHWTALKTVGVDPQTTITLQVSEITYASALEVTLFQAGLGKVAYTVSGDVIKISTLADIAATTQPASR